MQFRERSKPAPVRVGEELDVTIEAVGEKGDGVAKKDGFVLFVPNVKEGEQVRIKVTKVLRKVGFAEKIGEAGSAPAEAPREESFEEQAPAESEEPAEESESFGEDHSVPEESEETESESDDFEDEELPAPEPPEED